MKPFRPSVLDDDFYTLTVGQVAFKLFPTTMAKWTFCCRSKGVKFTDQFAQIFARRLQAMIGLQMTPEESSFMRALYPLDAGYLHFLQEFRFRPDQHVFWHVKDGDLYLDVFAPIAYGIKYEVPLLAMINEAYFDVQDYQPGRAEKEFEAGEMNLTAKIELIREYNRQVGDPAHYPKFFEMGTRRRRSGDWQWHVYDRLRNEVPENLIGTSNIALAKSYGEYARGTQSHQLYQIFQAMSPLQNFLCDTHRAWQDTHHGMYDVALTDIIGTEAFFRHFTTANFNQYSGFRWDSGDPRWWLDLVYDTLVAHKIDPRTKSVYLSNGLDVADALDLYGEYHHKFKLVVPCIGTKFTNHLLSPALNIVIKMTQCDGQPVAKISDDAGKGVCHDSNFLGHLCKTYKLK